jgi:hypothetical protein
MSAGGSERSLDRNTLPEGASFAPPTPVSLPPTDRNLSEHLQTSNRVEMLAQAMAFIDRGISERQSEFSRKIPDVVPLSTAAALAKINETLLQEAVTNEWFKPNALQQGNAARGGVIFDRFDLLRIVAVIHLKYGASLSEEPTGRDAFKRTAEFTVDEYEAAIDYYNTHVISDTHHRTAHISSSDNVDVSMDMDQEIVQMGHYIFSALSALQKSLESLNSLKRAGKDLPITILDRKYFSAQQLYLITGVSPIIVATYEQQQRITHEEAGYSLLEMVQLYMQIKSPDVRAMIPEDITADRGLFDDLMVLIELSFPEAIASYRTTLSKFYKHLRD